MTGGDLLAIQTSRLWTFTFLLSLLCFLFILLVFILRNRLSARSTYVAEHKRKLAPMISAFLFYQEDDSKEERATFLELKVALREQLKETKNRRILAETLRDLERDLSGTARSRLLALYTDLGLHYDAFAMLRSWHWQRIAQAIEELTQMQVTPAYDFIRPLINHRLGTVRQQAQIAIVRLRPEGIQYFLDSVRSRISGWQQMKLIDAISRYEDFNPPSFRLWLTSANADVVLFSLRLIKYYRQNEGRHAIVALSLHPDDRIKMAAMECVREFALTEAITLLKEGFFGFGNEVKMAVLDTLAALGTEEDLAFLQTIRDAPFEMVLKGKVLSCINSIAPDSILPDNIKETKAVPLENTSYESWGEEAAEERSLAPESKSNPEIEAGLDFFNMPALEEELNEELLALCCLEELEDLFMDATYPDRQQLSLAFLPLVRSEDRVPADHDPNGGGEHPIFAMEVHATVVDAEESFRLELQGILNRIGAREPMTNHANSEIFNLSFIPDTQQDEILQKPPEDTFGIPSEKARLIQGEPEGAIALENRTTDIDNNTEHKEFKRFSIFEELFRYCDTESKLLLLDEVLALGGEKEFRFLETLAGDGSEAVRKKSLHIAGLLQTKLQKEANSLEDVSVAPEGQTKSHAGDASQLEPPDDLREPLEFCFLKPVETTGQEASAGLFDIDFTLTKEEEVTAGEDGDNEASPETTGMKLEVPRVNSPGFSEIRSKHHG